MSAPTPRPPYQQALGKWIVDAEARRDRQGRIRVYELPAGDGGGILPLWNSIRYLKKHSPLKGGFCGFGECWGIRCGAG